MEDRFSPRAGDGPKFATMDTVIGGEDQTTVEAGQPSRMRAGPPWRQIGDTVSPHRVKVTGPQLVTAPAGRREIKGPAATGEVLDQRSAWEIREADGASSSAVGAPQLATVNSVIGTEVQTLAARRQPARP